MRQNNSKHWKSILLLAFLCLFLVGTAFSQAVLIKGTVTQQSDGSTLPGVTVLVKGTTTGTVTDFDGNYSLKADPQATLVFSFVGYTAQEVYVNGESTINVALTADVIGLEEVVAIGYTTRKKGEVTGSVSTVNSEQLERSSNKDVAKSLAGKVPGLIISDRGGYPGSTNNNDLSILIRGQSTLNNNSPLILIDGIQTANFSYLSPQDIESISVLKDGAAAIYGARAANGVILITTKRGKDGKPKINLSSTYSHSSFSVAPKLMSSEQYAIYSNEFAQRNGTSLPFTQDQIDKYAAGNDPNYPSTDWFDLTFADCSPELRTSLSISGGSNNVNYFVSGDLIDQVGMYESGDLTFRQYQVRSNLDIKLTDSFKLGVDLSGRFGNTNQPGVTESYIYQRIYSNEPTEIGIYPNGLIAWGGENGSNPYIMSSDEAGFDKNCTNDLRSKFSFDWKLDGLTKGLSAKGFAGVRRFLSDQKTWYTPWTVHIYQEGTDEYVPFQGYSQAGTQNQLTETFFRFDELMLNATIHYDRIFDEHTVRGFIGYEQVETEQRTFFATKTGFPTRDHSELFAGSDEGQLSSGNSSETGRVNYFGSLSYDYKKKYFMDLTFRRDGSSNFGDGKRFGTFPGVAVSWSLADENFMSFTDSWLNALKIRASWALMGNDRIPAFQFLTRYDYGGPLNNQGQIIWTQPNSYIFGTSGTSYNGYASSTVPNPDITWETADMKNIGMSFSMFNSKLSGDVNYFFQKREDILIARSASIPVATGLTLPQENLGIVDNFGWEFELSWKDKIGDLDYNFGMNFTQAKNEIVYMDEAADVPEYRKQEGHPMGSYLVYPTQGIFRDQAQVDATTVKMNGTVEGEPIYVDTDKNGKIDSGDMIRSYSSIVPEIQYGIYGGVSYKGVDFNFLFQGQAKAKMLLFFDQSGAKPEYVFTERWTPDNRDAKYPRAFAQGDAYSGNQGSANNFQGADFWLHDASFLRLKEVELGYTFPEDLVRFGNLKVFVRGNNLLTMFSQVYKYGLDPESRGYDNFRISRYPSLKTYSFGFNLTF